MIWVNIVKINSHIEAFERYKTSFSNSYNDYYIKNEYSSDYWVGKYATKYYDNQLSYKVTNQKIINNMEQFLNLMSFIYDRYSKVATKNFKIELEKRNVLEKKFKTIISILNNANSKLGNVVNINTNSASSTINSLKTSLNQSEDRTMKLFEKVTNYETQIRNKVMSMDIKKVEQLEIDSYMV